ncbi:MAG TPA: cytochrome c [Verrucomicrobiae bacterium]|jgi:hypothetical protein
MRYFILLLALGVVATMSLAGRRGDISRKPPLEFFDDMDRQLKLRPQTEGPFNADGRGSRLPITGTIARGERFEDTPFNTGRVTGTTNFIATLPVEITPAFLERGRERFNINCSPCHGAIGDGNGITKKIGAMAVVANLHDQRIVQMADGELFSTITYGKNLMGPYGANVAIDDRWAIIAYVRALQLARLGTDADVPAEHKVDLNKK